MSSSDNPNKLESCIFLGVPDVGSNAINTKMDTKFRKNVTVDYYWYLTISMLFRLKRMGSYTFEDGRFKDNTGVFDILNPIDNTMHGLCSVLVCETKYKELLHYKPEFIAELPGCINEYDKLLNIFKFASENKPGGVYFSVLMKADNKVAPYQAECVQIG